MTGGGSWGGDVAAILDQSATIEAQAVDALPLFETFPPLQTIVLGVAAFGLGWKIGSTINTEWLHINGAGLGVQPSGVDSARWAYSTNFAGVLAPAWTLILVQGGVTNGRGCPASACDDRGRVAYYNAATANGIGTKVPAGTLNGYQMYTWMFSRSDMYRALRIDQPLQPYTGTNQPVNGSSGWKISGGCGDVSNACSYPGSQPDPVLSAPHLRCQLSGDASDCGSGSPHVCVASDGSGLFGGAGSTGCGLGTGPEGQLDCQTDPADFACPTPTPGGSGFGSSGGYNGSEGPATAAGDDPCKFDDNLGGLDEWNTLNYDGSYDQDCADAWAAMRSAGYIDANGNPAPTVLASPVLKIRADGLGNPDLPDAFASADPGSELTQWWKVSTPRLTTADGIPFEVHFYENITDGVVYLGRDYYLVFKGLF